MHACFACSNDSIIVDVITCSTRKKELRLQNGALCFECKVLVHRWIYSSIFGLCIYSCDSYTSSTAIIICMRVIIIIGQKIYIDDHKHVFL